MRGADVPELTMLSNKLWLACKQERHVLEQVQQAGGCERCEQQ